MLKNIEPVLIDLLTFISICISKKRMIKIKSILDFRVEISLRRSLLIMLALVACRFLDFITSFILVYFFSRYFARRQSEIDLSFYFSIPATLTS